MSAGESWRTLPDATSTRVEPLFVNFLVDDAGLGHHGHQRAGGPRSVFGEQKRERFFIRRPGGIGKVAREVGQLARDFRYPR